MGFLGTFSMSFYIIFWTYSEKFSLLRIYSMLNLMVLAYIVMILLCVRMCGVTKLDKIRNERIRGTQKVGEITQKYRKEG